MENINFEVARKDLENYCRNFLEDTFGMELRIPVKINGRLKKSLGRFSFNSHFNRSVELEFSKDLLKYQTLEEIIGVVKHECIHYALFEQGLPYNDGDDYFEKTLIKHGASSTKTINSRAPKHVYECSCCGYSIHRNRKMNVNNYYCGKCSDINANFIYKGLEK